MMRLIQGHHSPIGLDLGRSAIRMIQFRTDGRGLSVQASGHYQLPRNLPAQGPERQSALLAGCHKILDNAPFHGSRVVSCLPVEQMQFKNVRMPKMPGDELSQAVQWEAIERLQLADKPHQIEYVVAGEVRQGEEVRNEIIMMVVSDAVLRDHLELLSACELKPIAIDAPAMALARCFARQYRRESDKQKPHVFVDIGLSSAKVLIVQGPHIRFFKAIDIGGEKLNQSIAEHLNLSIDDAAEVRRQWAQQSGEGTKDQPVFGSTRRESVERAVYQAVRSIISELGREIGLCMRYYSVTFRGHRPEQVVLVGGEAHEPQLIKAIAAELEMPVSVGEPLHGVDLSDSQIAIERRGHLPDWALACGLALRSAGRVASVKRGAA